MHVRKGRETVCIVPPSGLVTAIEPVLRACDGVWVASGSGNADAQNVDEFDRLRVPPDDPRYTLRRVWLSAEEESQLLRRVCKRRTLAALSHCAYAADLSRGGLGSYQRVNERFANALLDEMKGSVDPLVFVQDYHFALLPRLVKASASGCARGDLLAYSMAESGGIRDLSVAGGVAGWVAWRGSDRVSHSAALQ